nr:hypothetical protein [Acidimicrobiia bacterium]
VQGSSGGLVNLRVGLLGTQLWRYLGRPEILLLVVAAVLGWLYLRRSSPESFVRPLGLSLLLGGVPYLVFTGARPLWGSGNDYQANASFLRYSLPLIAVTSALAAGWVIAALSRRRWVAGVLAAVVLVGAFATTTRSPTNPVSYRRSVALDDQRQEQLLEIVPPDALVVTFKNDKLLWPQRSTLTAAYLAERQSAEITHVYDATPGPERLADVLLRLAELGEDVWLYDDSAWLGANPDMFPAFDLLLLEQGVQRLPTGVEALYRIQPPPSAG